MVKNKAVTGEGQSLEDVIISEYLDELRKTHTAGANNSKSPYAQRFPKTPYDAIVPRGRPPTGGGSARPAASAKSSGRRRPHSRTGVREAWSGEGDGVARDDPGGDSENEGLVVIDATSCEVDPAEEECEDQAGEGEEEEEESKSATLPPPRRARPGSAPVHGRRRLSSLHSDSALSLNDIGRARRPHTMSRRRRRAPLYMRQPNTILVTAFINGRRDVHARIAAPTIGLLLEQSTAKLQLPSAARRVFLPDGSEVHRHAYIPRDTEVFISMGEPFKNPYKSVKRIQELKQISTWTMTGLQLPPDRPRQVTKPKMSKRFRELNERKKRRILVFKNGIGTEPSEIVVDPDDIQGLFEACTLKFSMGSFARRIFTWNGTEVENLHEVPELHRLVQGNNGTPVLGPVWVSRGEGFSPNGSEYFLNDVISGIVAKLRTTQRYEEQLQFACDGQTDQIRLPSILSMSEEEVEEALEHVRKDIADHKELLKEYRRMRAEIADMVNQERSDGNEYTMKHIETIDSSNRLIGQKGLRLKVYENGNYDSPTIVYFNVREAVRGVKDQKLRFERFLDHCSYNCHLASQNSQARGVLAKRCFNSSGREITNLGTLMECYEHEGDDTELWLSHGEPWIDPYTYCLGAGLSKIRRLEIRGKNFVVLEDLSGNLKEGMERPGAWECVRGAPEDVPITKEPLNLEPSPEEEEENDDPLIIEEEVREPSGSIGNEHFFLQYKKLPEIVVFAEAGVSIKKPLNDGELFPAGSQSQQWVLNQEGNIYLKGLPQLALGLSDFPLRSRLPNGQTVSGFLVALLERSDNNPYARWAFESDGRLYNMGNSELVLTYLGVPLDGADAQPVNSESGNPAALSCSIGVCEPLTGKAAKYQRWGMKQERFDILGQWKHNIVANPEWNKRALSWPLDDKGQWNAKFEWPMEGYLIPCAPPLEPKKSEGGSVSMVPKRLFALKNGQRDVKQAVAVTGPDLTNMVKDRNLAQKKGKKKKARVVEEGKASSAGNDSVDGAAMHCTDMTLVQLEFKLFLERCTSLLGMTSAARRIFDSQGLEHFSLHDLDRDELVFVTAGEPWSDPTLSKEEMKRRQLLCMISDDVDRVRQFVQLRAPERLVVALDGGVADGVPVVVAQEVARKRKRHRQKAAEPTSPTRLTSTDDASSDDDSNEEQDLSALTAHERACQKADERLNRLKWPWERIVGTNGLDEVVEVNEAPRSDDEKAPDKETKSYKKAMSPRFHPRHLQRFGYEDNFIFPLAEPNLVLTAANSECRVIDVHLQKRKPDNVNQRWIIKANGFIYAKYRSSQVLTVNMPKAPASASQMELSYPGCQVTLQPIKNVQFGRANQQFCFNPIKGVIHAFHSSALDKEILAANTVNVCTFSIIPDEIDQLGYLVYLPSTEGKTKACQVCIACARSLRGRYKLQKLTPGSVDFCCCFGEAKRHGIRERGALRCLSGKVDLSTGEASATLDHWEDTLKSLRSELSVKRVQNRLAESRTPRPVRVLAYRNGEGRLGNPELIIGSSMRGLMDQCMYKLGLPRAVRRLYTEDGTPVVELDDLLNWYLDNKYRVHLRQRQIQEGELAPEVNEIREEVATMMAEAEAAGVNPAPPDQEVEIPEASLEPVLNSDEGFYEIGPISKKTSTYELSITVTELGKLDKLLSEQLVASVQVSFVLSFSLFGVDISSDPFVDEHHYSAERTTIRLRGELAILKQFFRKSFTRLQFELCTAEEEGRGTRVGTCSVPLTGLIPRDCPDLFRPVSSEGIWPFHRPSVDGEGGRTEALLCVELKLVRELDLREETGEPENGVEEADNRSREAENGGEEAKEDADHAASEESIDLGDEDLAGVVIEVWASTGEPFVPLKTVYHDYRQMLRQRAVRQGVSTELDTQKHVLRHMQARRLDAMRPGDYRATMDPENPVLIQGNWQHPNTEEQLKNDAIYNLQGRLDEIKVRQATTSRAMRLQVDPHRELYQQPSMKRILIFPNGEDCRQAVYVWGESLHQLMDNAIMRLGLRKTGRCIYNLEGQRIREFEEIERDQMVCISTGEPFMKPKKVQEQVEVRANWSRARRMYGTKATEVAVLSRPNAVVGVDPFGPPGLIRRPDPPPTFENKRVLVYENGKHRENAITVFGDCLEALLTNATRRLNLRKPAVCFYNSKGDKIIHFDDVSRDEVLAVSTSGKAFIK